MRQAGLPLDARGAQTTRRPATAAPPATQGGGGFDALAARQPSQTLLDNPVAPPRTPLAQLRTDLEASPNPLLRDLARRVGFYEGEE